MSKKEEKRKNKKKKEILSGVKGELRELHFSSGGSLREWVGVGGVQKNSEDKRQTRRTKKEKAIKDSNDE